MLNGYSTLGSGSGGLVLRGFGRTGRRRRMAAFADRNAAGFEPGRQGAVRDTQIGVARISYGPIPYIETINSLRQAATKLHS